jgi:uncharacterized MAPEG superfamily protein
MNAVSFFLNLGILTMNLPTWILLAFAGWTLLILFSTVGVYRWSRILTGRATISEWQAGQPQGSDWYQRAMAAHRNCIENLPVFAAIVIAINHFELNSQMLDSLALGVLIARIAQSLIHICLKQSDRVATWRFIFFFAQIIAMIWMGIYIVLTV